jgi:hypothetical protein
VTAAHCYARYQSCRIHVETLPEKHPDLGVHHVSGVDTLTPCDVVYVRDEIRRDPLLGGPPLFIFVILVQMRTPQKSRPLVHPTDSRRSDRPAVMVRWWWPGAVSPSVVDAELGYFSACGFDGVELQCFSLNAGPTVAVGEGEYHAAVTAAQDTAARMGLALHLTSSTGWPMATTNMRTAEMHIAPPSNGVEALLRRTFPMFAGLDPQRAPGTLERTGRTPLASACPGAWVVDHLSTAGANDAANFVFQRIVGGKRVHEVLIDSFELFGHLPFTTDFLETFRCRYKYDLTPFLPHIAKPQGEYKHFDMMRLGVYAALRAPFAYRLALRRGAVSLHDVPLLLRSNRTPNTPARRDYEEHRAHLFHEFMVTLIQRLRTRFASVRIQAHGGYGHALDVYALADVPETETLYAGGSVEFMSLATSAARVARRRYSSCETLIAMSNEQTVSLRQGRRLIGRGIAAGCGSFVFHGAPLGAGEWCPFAPNKLTGPFHMTTNIKLMKMSDVQALVQLARFGAKANRAGEAVTDVGWVIHESRCADRVVVAAHALRPHAGESEVARHLRRLGLTYTQLSPRAVARASVLDGDLVVGACRFATIVVDDVVADENMDVVNVLGAVSWWRSSDVRSLRRVPSLLRPVGSWTAHVQKRATPTWARVILYNDDDVPATQMFRLDGGLHKLVVRRAGVDTPAPRATAPVYSIRLQPSEVIVLEAAVTVHAQV